jgi:D-aminopeptidase
LRLDIPDFTFDLTLPEARREVFLHPSQTAQSEKRRRFRELGVKLDGYPTGPNNAITDAGVLVGHATIIKGDGALEPGKGPVRTGVTVVIPHAGDVWNQRSTAGHFVLNGNGSMTGLSWIAESGLLEGPIALTNTHSVGDVYSGLIRWMQDKHPAIGVDDDTYLPVVGECDDSPLNDIRGLHVTSAHVKRALDEAAGGKVAEGSVGAGTGMTCYEFKGGIGTSSRVVPVGDKTYTVGVLVNANHGRRAQLKMLGVSVGEVVETELASRYAEGSIVVVVATDAPLSPTQLDRIAKRATMGLARTGAVANHGSGDFVIAFSNGRLVRRKADDTVSALPQLADGDIDPLFSGAVEATEEAVLNALCAATAMVGRDGNTAPALPLERVQELLKQHGHVVE